jgi:1-acyl-sn-glycerol-3-phosphate acyltransferase
VCFVAWYAALYFRIVPRPLMQVWFLVTHIPCLLCIVPLTYAIDALSRFAKIIPAPTAHRLCHIVGCLFFRLATRLNPQMRFIFCPTPSSSHTRSRQSLDDAAAAASGSSSERASYRWEDIPHNTGLLMCMNHTSLYDMFLTVAVTPFAGLGFNCRPMYKKALDAVPIVGNSCRHAGYFPVHFQRYDDENCFTVKQVEQADVQRRVEHFLVHEGGVLSMYPEGRINSTPETMLPVRFGSIKMAVDKDIPIALLVFWGGQHAWPRKARVGGHPADIYYTVAMLEVPPEVRARAQEQQEQQPTQHQGVSDHATNTPQVAAAATMPDSESRAGPSEKSDSNVMSTSTKGLDAKLVAQLMQDQMQRMIDALRAHAAGRAGDSARVG